MRSWSGFFNGEEYHEIFSTSVGDVPVMGTLHLTRDTVKLCDVLIEPTGTRHLVVGPKALFDIRQQLLDRVSREGYTELVLEGQRTSGASPNRPVRIRRTA